MKVKIFNCYDKRKYYVLFLYIFLCYGLNQLKRKNNKINFFLALQTPYIVLHSKI